MYRSIHHLRAFAALAIVALHAGFPVGRWQLDAGIEVFFVISGFVIYASAATQPFRFLDYAWRRFVRILPLWWAALGWFIVFSLVFMLGALPDSSRILPSIVLIPDEFRGEVRPILNVGWTLIYELMFYALFGLAVWIGRWWLAALVIFALVAAGWCFSPQNDVLAFYTDHIMLAFVAGMFIAHARQLNLRLPVYALPLGLVLLAIQTPWHPILPAALIVAGVVALEQWWPKSAICDFLGSASYAIYLFHFSVTFVAERLYENTHWLIIIVAAAGLGCLAHVAVERPLLRFVRNAPRLFRNERRVPAE